MTLINRSTLTILSLSSLALTAACGSDDAPAVPDVSGAYTVALTNRANECMFDGWNEGDTATGVAITITQSGTAIVAEVQGLAALALDARLGSHTFRGVASGDVIDMTIEGMNADSMGACAYTLNADLHATLVGDSMSGTLEYTAATNDASDCDYWQTCSNAQAFNGARAPR